MSPRLRHFRLVPVLWAFACALLIRAMLPAGVMLSASGADGPVFEICSGAGAVEMVLDAQGRLRPAEHAPSDRQAGHAPDACPFAGGHIFTATETPEAPVPTALAEWTPTAALPRLGVATLHLRAPPPPSHAPPIRFV